MVGERDRYDRAVNSRVNQTLSTSICTTSTANVGIERESKKRPIPTPKSTRKILVLNPESNDAATMQFDRPICQTHY
jgi:hypothetical protein